MWIAYYTSNVIFCGHQNNKTYERNSTDNIAQNLLLQSKLKILTLSSMITFLHSM